MPANAGMTVTEDITKNDWRRHDSTLQSAFVFKSAKTFRARTGIVVPDKATSQSRLLYEFQKTDESFSSEMAMTLGQEIQCSQILDLFNAFVLHLELPMYRT